MNNTATTTPTARRLAAITAVGERFRTDMDIAPVETMAEAIRALAPLGRTANWKANVAAWSQLVIDHPDNRAWALMQGAVWAANAA